jgi:uncharacterized protein YukE
VATPTQMAIEAIRGSASEHREQHDFIKNQQTKIDDAVSTAGSRNESQFFTAFQKAHDQWNSDLQPVLTALSDMADWLDTVADKIEQQDASAHA